MVEVLTNELHAYQWALPESIDVPPDELKARLDFYQDTIIFYSLNNGVITTKMVSAQDIALAVLSETNLNSGLLPGDTLWWKQTRTAVEVALWRPPKVWPVVLQEDAFQPAHRFRLPMPGLIFICSSGQAPHIYAVKKRPQSSGEFIYRVPLYNVYDGGSSCAGTHKYPQDVSKIPESFFAAFFTKAAVNSSRSQKYPDNLLKLWEEIDDKPKYPMNDLVKMGTVGDLLK